uniref:Uncharacterized protein n=1 Tax=Arundo donax TaxID=35708 RepID=A0A0A9A621_ARUDO
MRKGGQLSYTSTLHLKPQM